MLRYFSTLLWYLECSEIDIGGYSELIVEGSEFKIPGHVCDCSSCTGCEILEAICLALTVQLRLPCDFRDPRSSASPPVTLGDSPL